MVFKNTSFFRNSDCRILGDSAIILVFRREIKCSPWGKTLSRFQNGLLSNRDPEGNSEPGFSMRRAVKEYSAETVRSIHLVGLPGQLADMQQMRADSSIISDWIFKAVMVRKRDGHPPKQAAHRK
jgi:hypothetical protein